MTGIACSIAASPTWSTVPSHSSSLDHDNDDNSVATFEASDCKTVRFDGEDTCCNDNIADPAPSVRFENIESEVQKLFDNIPDYTNVPIFDRSQRKYTPLHI